MLPGVRDPEALAAVVAEPQARTGGEAVYGSLAEKASALGQAVIERRPFVVGNERVAFAATEALLRLNGHRIDGSDDEVVEAFRAFAAGELDRAGFASWVRRRIQPLRGVSFPAHPMPWLAEFGRAFGEEFENGPAVAVLASVDETGAPDARCVIVRLVDASGRLCFTSDGQSRKNAQLRSRPLAALVFWLAGRREQYRLSGPVEFVSDAAERRTIWRSLGRAGRALFSWPEPGRPLAAGTDPDRFAREVSEDAPIPDRFEVIAVRPTRVEHLDLKEHPHRRRRWCASDGWQEHLVTP